MWMHHWGLARDPFASLDSPFVALPAHAEAADRLIQAIETAQPLVILTADAGLGKSTVLRQALARAVQPLAAARFGERCCGKRPALERTRETAG